MKKINTDHLKELAETMNLIAQHQLDKASQIYYCVVKSVSNNQCTIIFNNKQYTVPYYGGKPTPNKTYAIFLPHNNMNESFVIGDGKDGGTEGRIIPISEGGTGADNIPDAIANFGIINLIYPVGSIYMSVNSVSPATLFGGTWEQLEDRFLLAAGDTYTAGDTGGEATHTLTESEMPSHAHEITTGANSINSSGSVAQRGFGSVTVSSQGTTSVGSGDAHNNMPPYLVVYMWKRTA